MKRILVTLVITLILCLQSNVGTAQQQFWNWYFGNQCAVNFSSGNPVAVAGGQTNVVEGTATISDASGNLLFYTDGMSVWNRLNAVMPNGSGLHGNSSSTESAIIVAMPGSTTKYYIFTTDGGSYGVYYYIVDMTLAAGFGDVISNAGVGILLNAPEKVTAVRHCNGVDVWVISHTMQNNTYYAWLVSATGVAAPVTSNAGTVYTDMLGYLKVSPNSRKIGCALFTQEIAEVLDFDNSTGLVSNSNVITIPLPPEYAYGLSFSPNSQVLYEIGDASGAQLLQWDLSSNVQATVIASQYVVVVLPTSGGDIQIGPNGKMYVDHYGSNYIDVINNPNVLGAGCGWQTNVCTLTGTCMIGFPNWIDAFNPQPVPSVPHDTTVCTPTCVLDAGAGATTYLWSTGATTETISVSVSATYTCVVTGLNICGNNVQHDTINVHILPPVVVNLGNDTTLCATLAGLNLDAGNPGATFHWSNNDTTQISNVTTSGNYSVTVTAGSCVDIDTIHVTFNPAPIVNLGNDTVICAGNPMTLDAGNAGSTYSWSTGANTQTLAVSTTNTYSVTATLAGCTDIDTILVTFITNLTVNLGPDVTVCNGQPVTIDAGNAGSTYLWSTGATTQTISVSSTGIYTVTVTGGTCSATDAITVTFAAALIVNLGPDVSVCVGVPVTLNAANAGSTFLWSDGETTQTITPINSGTYMVTVTNGTCVTPDTVNVVFNPLPIVNIGSDKNLCNATPVTLDAGNLGATYLWSTGANTQTITVTVSGTYSVLVQNGTCAGSDTMILVEGTSPTVNLGPDIFLCYGETVKLDAGNVGLTYGWSNGQTSQIITANTTGIYVVKVNNAGCYGYDTIHVTIHPEVIVSLGPDTFICPGDQLFLNAGIGFTYYAWSPIGGNKHFAVVDQPGTYYCLVTDSNGCTGISSKFVREFCPTELYIPNAFSPNGNSLNDIFIAIGDGIVGFHMYVFDRWGETIFEATDISQGWDGTYNGSDCPVGSYIYRVDYQKYDYLELKKHTKYGVVNLVR